MWLEGHGAQKINPGATGGKIPRGNFSVGITDVRHSATTIEADAPVYLGSANGFRRRERRGADGDTGISGDTALIAEPFAPKIGLVPAVIACHYGAFDAPAPTLPSLSRRCKARSDSRNAPVIARSEATRQSRRHARLLDCFDALAMTALLPKHYK
jgi:hypothetical protein